MKKRAFSLVELLVAVMLIGLAVVSLLAANSAFTRANGTATDLSTAEFLIEQIRELTALLPVVDPNAPNPPVFFGAEEPTLAGYNDLDDFDGRIFSPPISADRILLHDLAAFSQRITVENVDPANFEQVFPDHGSPFVRVTVTVALNSTDLTSTSWIRARY